jgi:ABC-type amino acid transport system permease subunit
MTWAEVLTILCLTFCLILAVGLSEGRPKKSDIAAVEVLYRFFRNASVFTFVVFIATEALAILISSLLDQAIGCSLLFLAVFWVFIWWDLHANIYKTQVYSTGLFWSACLALSLLFSVYVASIVRFRKTCVRYQRERAKGTKAFKEVFGDKI